MFILDTNVVSELMRRAPDPAVASWVAERATSGLFLTAVTEAELRFGLAIMPPGKRREGLATSLERMLETGFANRILPFDSGAAHAYVLYFTLFRQNSSDYSDARPRNFLD